MRSHVNTTIVIVFRIVLSWSSRRDARERWTARSIAGISRTILHQSSCKSSLERCGQKSL